MHQIEVFELKDVLNHHQYRWPTTVVSFPIRTNLLEQFAENEMLLLDETGNPIPFQLRELPSQEEGDSSKSTRIFITTGLNTGQHRRFTLYSSSKRSVHEDPPRKVESLYIHQVENKSIVHNGRIQLNVIVPPVAQAWSAEQPIFTIGEPGGRAIGEAYLDTKHSLSQVISACTAEGPVFYEHSLTFRFAGGASYQIILRLAEGKDYAELREEMEGFRPEDAAQLRIEWQSFAPAQRYLQGRGFEKIDQYMNDGGELPSIVTSYVNWVCWQKTKTAVFTDHETSIGVFTKDIDSWNDGEYALWGTTPTHAIRFYWEDSLRKGSKQLRWVYPLSAGMRCTAVALYEAGKDAAAKHEAYINDLYLWHEFLNLDKVKDWVLEWEEDQQAYPRFFRHDNLPAEKIASKFFERTERPAASDLEAIINNLSFCLNHVYETNPVAAREFFAWVPIFDLTAPTMTREQFNRFKTACAFMAYVHNDANLMPVRHMLSGHPNFLVDMMAVAGMMSALFPNHPSAIEWKEQFERTMALNMKYHVRPDVPEWEADGGRHTENLACYTHANLNAMMKPAKLLRKAWKENPVLYPAYTKWMDWLLHALSAPVDGLRHYPSQGAHAGGHVDDYTVPLHIRMAGEELTEYDPLLAEYLMNVSTADARTFEEKIKGSEIWRALPPGSSVSQQGTRPPLRSRKFTGYGFIMRSEVGTPNEMSVHLQQIDEGPNYRWGRAGNGGNGVIYYYAAGKRYSFNRKEDIGDDNMGDVQGSSNFGVLYGHEFRSIGRNELTEPLLDFGFAQFALIHAGLGASPAYRSRSVLMSGSDYIVIYDQVGDMRVRGRFSWFVSEKDEFPSIRQLKPGVAGYAAKPGIPAELGPHQYANRHEESKGLHFDGSGNFLTMISHHTNAYNGFGPILQVDTTDYGAKIKLSGREDYIFRDEAEIHYDSRGITFTGYAGIVRLHGEYKAEAAIFQGKRIAVRGVDISIRPADGSGAPEAAGIGFTLEQEQLRGQMFCRGAQSVEISLPEALASEDFRFYMDGKPHPFERSGDRTIVLLFEPGRHAWQWTVGLPVPEQVQVTGYTAASGLAAMKWAPSAGAECYHIDISGDCGVTWTSAARDIRATSYTLTGEDGSKRHIRVRAANSDHEGEWSYDYPVYFTESAPKAPDGLRIRRFDEGFALTWGWQLGADRYKVYRREQEAGTFEVIYEGEQPYYTDQDVSAGRVYEYRVSACNGNGEGPLSPARNTKPGGLVDWDPRPEETFRRDTRSHEFGYDGFDHWANAMKPILTYPGQSK